MKYKTQGSIRSLKIDSSTVSVSIKGLASYSNTFDKIEYLLLVEDIKTAKYIISDTSIEIIDPFVSVIMSFLTDALKNKTVLKFTIEEAKKVETYKYQITAIEMVDEKH